VSSKILLFISIALIAAGLLVLRFQYASRELTIGLVVLKGTVQDDPKVKDQSTYFNFQGYQIITYLYPKISYGDVISLDGEANEKGFISYPKIEKLDRKDNLRTFLFTIRSNIDKKINKFLPEPQASLLSGVLLGIDKGLPDDFQEDLRTTGTIHVVVVSGYNIMLVGGLFLLLSGAIKRKYAVTLSIIAIIFYTLLTGAQPPTIRAAIMGTLAFSATILGRQNLPFYSLMLAGFLMLMIDPFTLNDIGFQLSFMATAGIILFKDMLFNYLKRIPSPIGEDLTTTIAAQLLVVPIIFFHFGQVSLVSALVNALVLWTIPLATILGFGVAAFGLIVEPLGQFIAWIAWVPLSIFTWVVQAFARIPFAQIQVPRSNIFPPLIYYTAVGIFIFLINRYVRIYKKKSK